MYATYILDMTRIYQTMVLDMYDIINVHIFGNFLFMPILLHNLHTGFVLL